MNRSWPPARRCSKAGPISALHSRAAATLGLLLALALLLLSCGNEGQQAGSSRQTSGNAAAAVTTVTPTTTPIATTADRAADSFSGQQSFQHVLALAETIGPRPAGSAAEGAAARYIAQQLRSYGLTVTEQPFTFQSQEARAEVVSPQPITLDAAALFLSPAGEVTAEVVAAGKGFPEDLPSQRLRGKIALIARGEIFFSDKVRNAHQAGAVAAIIYNNQPGPFQGTLLRTEAIPAISIPGLEGQRLLAMLAQGPVTVHLAVRVVTQESRNVIARPAEGECRILVGAHYDSVPQGPGANDNASGTAVLLGLAQALADRSGELGVCFVAFGAEELGLLGSEYLVQELSPQERSALRAMINLDMVAVGSQWLVAGSSDMVALALTEAQALDIEVEAFQMPPGLGSDHQSFLAAGIPALFIHRMDDPNYHTAQDRAQFVDLQALTDAGRLALRLVERLAAGS